MKKILLIVFIFCIFFMLGCKTSEEKEASLYVCYSLNNGTRDIVEKVEDLSTYKFLKVEREGYRFSGWYGDEEFEAKMVEEDLEMPAPGEEKIVYLYAKWVKNQYRVAFKCDGSEVNVQYVDYNESAVAANPKQKAGYKFVSWDKDFSKVTCDMEVNAVYVETNEKNVMVILGNWMNDNGTISAIMKQRLELALVAYKDFGPAYIVVSGGMANAKAGISEAQAMYNYLVEKGIDKNIIIKEDQSMSTYQNAIYTMTKLENINFKNLIIVSTIEHFVSYQTIKYFNDAAYNNEIIRNKNINIMIYTNNNIV